MAPPDLKAYVASLVQESLANGWHNDGACRAYSQRSGCRIYLVANNPTMLEDNPALRWLTAGNTSRDMLVVRFNGASVNAPPSALFAGRTDLLVLRHNGHPNSFTGAAFDHNDTDGAFNPHNKCRLPEKASRMLSDSEGGLLLLQVTKGLTPVDPNCLTSFRAQVSGDTDTVTPSCLTRLTEENCSPINVNIQPSCIECAKAHSSALKAAGCTPEMGVEFCDAGRLARFTRRGHVHTPPSPALTAWLNPPHINRSELAPPSQSPPITSRRTNDECPVGYIDVADRPVWPRPVNSNAKSVAACAAQCAAFACTGFRWHRNTNRCQVFTGTQRRGSSSFWINCLPSPAPGPAVRDGALRRLNQVQDHFAEHPGGLGLYGYSSGFATAWLLRQMYPRAQLVFCGFNGHAEFTQPPGVQPPHDWEVEQRALHKSFGVEFILTAKSQGSAETTRATEARRLAESIDVAIGPTNRSAYGLSDCADCDDVPCGQCQEGCPPSSNGCDPRTPGMSSRNGCPHNNSGSHPSGCTIPDPPIAPLPERVPFSGQPKTRPA